MEGLQCPSSLSDGQDENCRLLPIREQLQKWRLLTSDSQLPHALGSLELCPHHPPTWNGGVGHGVSRNLFCKRWCSTVPFFSFTSSVSSHAKPLSKAVPCFLTSDPQKLWTMAGGLPSDSSVDGYQSHPCDSFSPRTLPPPASAFGGPSSVPSTHISLFYPKFIVALNVRFYLSPANTPSLVS